MAADLLEWLIYAPYWELYAAMTVGAITLLLMVGSSLIRVARKRK